MTVNTCPLCQAGGEETLWSDPFCRVIRVDDDHYPGYCRVILNAHVKEMTDLPPADRQRLMAVVFAVEAAVREVCRPAKVNLASLGNVVPHLHWHVIPRWIDDVNFPDSVWTSPRRTQSQAVNRGPDPSTLRWRLAERLADLLRSGGVPPSPPFPLSEGEGGQAGPVAPEGRR